MAFFENARYASGLFLFPPIAHIGEEGLYNAADTLAFLHNTLPDVLFHALRAALINQYLTIVYDAGDGIVDFMSNSGGQLPQGSHMSCLHRFRLHRHLFGDITHKQKYAADPLGLFDWKRPYVQFRPVGAES